MSQCYISLLCEAYMYFLCRLCARPDYVHAIKIVCVTKVIAVVTESQQTVGSVWLH